MKYKIIVSTETSASPIECERYQIDERGLTYWYGDIIGFIVHGAFSAVLPL